MPDSPKPDPSLLALVIDDALAPKVLAAWKAAQLKIGALNDDDEARDDFAELVGAEDDEALCVTLRRCETARLLVDGGISDIAESFLSAYVGRSLGLRAKPPAKPKAPK